MIESTRVEALFEEALAKPPAKRADFLDHACEGNRELRQEVERLLAAHPHAEGFLDRPAIFAAAINIAASAERSAYVLEACGDDHQLRREVEKLVADHFRAGQVLEQPAAHPAATFEKPVRERPGTVIGPYKLLEQIGEGGFGRVFVAEQQEPVRRRVALKIIKPGMDSAQVIARFEAERQALAMMDHQNIAKVYDAGTTGSGRPFFVMELVHGTSITEYCDSNRLTPRQRLELFVPICHAIQHAHQNGIIHRDIKPSNILVTMYDDKPVPKVIDFGVAKAIGQRLTDRSIYTQYGTLVGTFEYMSPEQAEMNAFGVDTRSDIYSLGVLLYELLTGTTPLGKARLRAAAFDEIRRIIKEEEPPRPSVRLSTSAILAKVAEARQTDPAKLARLVRGELDWVVMTCLEKDRTRRYETANALARDVERYLNDEPVQACPPSAAYRFRKFARRNKGPVLAACVVFVALIAGIIGTTWGLLEARAARDEEANQREHAQANLELAKASLQDARRAVNESFTILSESTLVDTPASQSLRKDLLEAALKYYQSFLERGGNDPSLQAEVAAAHFRVATIYLTLNRPDAAVEEFVKGLDVVERYVRAHPDDAEFPLRVGGLSRSIRPIQYTWRPPSNAAQALQALARAVILWEGFVRRYPLVPEFQQDLALLYLITGRYLHSPLLRSVALVPLQKARDLLEKLVHDNPAQPDHKELLANVHGYMGNMMFSDNRMAEGLECYHKGAELLEQLSTKFPTVWRYRDRLWDMHRRAEVSLAKRGPEQEAAKAAQRAAAVMEKLVADFPLEGYRKELAKALHRKGQREEAIASLKKAVDLDPQNAEAHYNLGLARQKEGEVAEAIACFLQTVKLKVDHSQAHTSLSSALASQGGLQAFMNVAEELLQAHADHCQAHYWAAWHLTDCFLPLKRNPMLATGKAGALAQACEARAREVLAKAARLKDARVAKDAVEAETLAVALAKCPVELQWMRIWDDKKWSNAWQQLCRSKRNDYVEFELPAQAGRVALAVHFTKAGDYAIVEVTVDGKVVGRPFDGFDLNVVPSGPIEFGVLEPSEGPRGCASQLSTRTPGRKVFSWESTA